MIIYTVVTKDCQYNGIKTEREVLLKSQISINIGGL